MIDDLSLFKPDIDDDSTRKKKKKKKKKKSRGKMLDDSQPLLNTLCARYIRLRGDK